MWQSALQRRQPKERGMHCEAREKTEIEEAALRAGSLHCNVRQKDNHNRGSYTVSRVTTRQYEAGEVAKREGAALQRRQYTTLQGRQSKEREVHCEEGEAARKEDQGLLQSTVSRNPALTALRAGPRITTKHCEQGMPDEDRDPDAPACNGLQQQQLQAKKALREC
eukprot:scaffold33133_cov22-Tisochrysis_lutea.AAC.3